MTKEEKPQILNYILIKSISALMIGCAAGFFISTFFSNIDSIGVMLSGVFVIIGSSLNLINRNKHKDLFNEE